jgi:branched-chain amino acid transport system permease protein
VTEAIQVLVAGLVVGSMYALVALGYTLVYGLVRVINFAHGDAVAVSGLLGSVVLVALARNGWAVLPCIAVAVAIMAAAASVLNLATLHTVYEPLLRRSRSAAFIGAIAVSLALENAAQLTFGTETHSFPALLSHRQLTIPGTDAYITVGQVVLLVAGLAVAAAVWALAHRTWLGASIRAFGADRDAAALMGIDAGRTLAIVFVLAGTLAAAAGLLLGLYYTQLSPTTGLALGLTGFTAAVAGGMGNIGGAVLGGLLIGLVDAGCSAYISSRWTAPVTFGVLIVLLTVRPTGLLGERLVREA